MARPLHLVVIPPPFLVSPQEVGRLQHRSYIHVNDPQEIFPLSDRGSKESSTAHVNCPLTSPRQTRRTTPKAESIGSGPPSPMSGFGDAAMRRSPNDLEIMLIPSRFLPSIVHAYPTLGSTAGATIRDECCGLEVDNGVNSTNVLWNSPQIQGMTL